MTRPFTGRHMATILVAFFGVVIAVNLLMAKVVQHKNCLLKFSFKLKHCVKIISMDFENVTCNNAYATRTHHKIKKAIELLADDP